MNQQNRVDHLSTNQKFVLSPLSKSLVRSRQVSLDPYQLVDKDLPVRVLQFGEGGFLRGFADWMIHRMNAQGVFNGRVIIVQPIPSGTVDILNKQEGLYTLIRRGIELGKQVEEIELITSVSHGINPYTDFQSFLDCASLPELRIIISNTTEAGIVLDKDDRIEANPPRSFPGKLTRFLWERYRRMRGDRDKGFIILPCELIDRNGDSLQKIVRTLAEGWTKDQDFIEWIGQANSFCNTLVDGIMTGYPKDEIESLQEKLGYRDDLLDTGELYRLWVIEGPDTLREEFPLDRVGINVVWTKDMTPYRTRKVRILNGIHTMTAPIALASGIETVREAILDPVFSCFVRKTLYEEIIPVLPLPQAELETYAESVLERFSNPFIRHQWASIALNSCAKFRARVLPTIQEYQEKFDQPPKGLSFSFAALLFYYRGTIHP
ncbi:MAG: tagaturonate reductase, partial [Spirochaetes bacterium]|nr:tagaturonate reductase [Spirochaetota bacterium]